MEPTASNTATIEQATEESEGPLRWRLWPGAVIPAGVLAGALLPGQFVPGTLFQFLGLTAVPLLGILLTGIWWLFLSRAPKRVRWRLAGLFAISGIAAAAIAEPNTRLILPLLAWPTVVFVSVLAAIPFASSPQANSGRFPPGVAVAMLASWAFWTAVRCDGTDGHVVPEFAWRWSPTAEDHYLAALNESQTATPTSTENETLVAGESDWPGFRGADRNGIVLEEVSVDWDADGPPELWRRRVGPGWSSFSVVDSFAFTQEQRGDEECVVCLDARTGVEIWHHSHATRFTEMIGGAGPRATPTLHDGRLYALGANGHLDCLDPIRGDEIWTTDITEVDNARIPDWGFSSSPLAIDNRIIVFGAGDGGKGVLAFDAETGDLLWANGSGAHSYCSPHFAVLDDVPQILMVTAGGIESLDIDSGKVLWGNEWPLPGYRVVQPLVSGNSVLYGTGNGMGTRCLRIESSGGDDKSWTAEESWTSRDMKPYFNDFVIHEGCVYGFDNNIFACVDLESGKRKWKRGRYGMGQLLLLAEQDLLLIITEKTGEVVLVEANPEKHVERTRFKAITGKTWNHPTVAQGLLLVRNGEEAACFDLSPEDAADSSDEEPRQDG